LIGLALAPGLVFNRENALTVSVGVHVSGTPGGARVAARTVERLEYYAQDIFEIVVYASEDEMKRDVAARRLDCGYAFAEDAEALETEGAIAVYRSPASVAHLATDLLVAAAYIENFAGVFGSEVLRPFFKDEEKAKSNGNPLDESLQARADEYLRGGALMEIIISESGEAKVEAAGAPYRNLFRGLVGLLSMLLALLCAAELAGDTAESVLSRIKSTGRGGAAFALAGIASVFTVTTLFIFITMLAGQIFFPGVAVEFKTEMIIGLSYGFALAGVSSLLSAIFREEAFPAVISFIFIFTALLGGAFFDVREIISSASFARNLIPYFYYTEGALGPADAFWRNAGILLSSGVVSGASALLIGRK